jgi:PST family polysaccharide transporter/antigen flippase
LSWLKASLSIAIAHGVRLLGGLIVIKMIAIYLGPEGFGRLGHFMSLIAILSVLAGGGILNGMVKYVSEYKQQPENLNIFLSNALAYSLAFSSLLFVVLMISAKPISLILFKSVEYSELIMVLGGIQFLYAIVNFCNGTINGLRETFKFSKILVIGTLIGLPINYYAISHYGFTGAVVGLALVNACLLLPALFELSKLEVYKRIKFSLNRPDTYRLSKFSLMQMISLATLPLAEIYVRNLIIDNAGWYETGLWQSLMRLSSVYVGFFTTFLAAYYMPTLSSIVDKNQVVKYVTKYVLGVGVAFMLIAVMLYVFRELVFTVIFSKAFVIPAGYLGFQLLGDLFKIMSYVIAFLVVAKARARLYVMGELIQTALYLGIATWFIKVADVSKVFSAYAVSNFLYFSVCVFALLWFKRTFSENESILK